MSLSLLPSPDPHTISDDELDAKYVHLDHVITMLRRRARLHQQTALEHRAAGRVLDGVEFQAKSDEDSYVAALLSGADAMTACFWCKQPFTDVPRSPVLAACCVDCAERLEDERSR